MLHTRLMWPLATCISSTCWTPRPPSLVFFLYTVIIYPHPHAISPTLKFYDLSSWNQEQRLPLSARDTPQLTLQTYVRSKASRLNITGLTDIDDNVCNSGKLLHHIFALFLALLHFLMRQLVTMYWVTSHGHALVMRTNTRWVKRWEDLRVWEELMFGQNSRTTGWIFVNLLGTIYTTTVILICKCK